eukprot:3336436-Amphidinium_carterae.1
MSEREDLTTRRNFKAWSLLSWWSYTPLPSEGSPSTLPGMALTREAVNISEGPSSCGRPHLCSASHQDRAIVGSELTVVNLSGDIECLSKINALCSRELQKSWSTLEGRKRICILLPAAPT